MPLGESSTLDGTTPHVVVVGGGIAGLTAAHALLQDSPSGLRPRVTLIEADRRLGGKIRSEQLAGQAIDVGAESLMVRAPAALDLCRELGLEGELVAPRTTATGVWARGRPRELPPGMLGGLPNGVGPVLRSGILSPAGIARASLDLVLPGSPGDGDRAVGELVRRRLGRQALDRLVDPLLGSIYAAHSDTLSLRATAPQIEAIARGHRSLIRGLRAAAQPRRPATSEQAAPERRAGPANAGQPPFATLPGGLERIVGCLHRQIRDVERIEQAQVRTGTAARYLMRAADGRYRLALARGEPLLADGIVIAAPAPHAAHILEPVAPQAAGELRQVAYLSVVVVTLRYPASSGCAPAHRAGLLVPHGQGRMLGACTWLSAKWPHLAGDGDIWVRCSVARAHTERALRQDDAELVGVLCGELRQAAGLAGAPLDAHVMRWHNALPHYKPGHLDRVERVERQLENLPGVALAGSAYRGMGVPQCISQGRQAAERVLGALAASPVLTRT